MPIAELGPWKFLVPEGWDLKAYSDGISYFEAPGGAHGMYVKSLELQDRRDSARDVGTYVQETHQNSFENLDQSNWTVVDRRGNFDGTLYRSALDMYDSGSRYRVLSLVVSDEQQAIQVTIHDYFCENYESAKRSHADVESSISRRAGASAA